MVVEGGLELPLDPHTYMCEWEIVKDRLDYI